MAGEQKYCAAVKAAMTGAMTVFMIGLVLVTHGKLAEEFRHAVEHVVGPQKFIETVCDRPRRRYGSAAQDISMPLPMPMTGTWRHHPDRHVRRHALQPRHLGDGSGRVEVIAGMNLPMLIKLPASASENNMAKALVEAQEAGRKYINVASRVLSGK
jgi:PTS system mannose-specific IIA component